MITPYLALVGLLASSLTFRVDGFVPNGLQKSTTRTSAPLVSEFMRATPVKESETSLSEEEEDVLFGEKNAPFDFPSKTLGRSGNGQADNSIQLNTLDHAKDPIVNKLRILRETLSSCPELWGEVAKICPEKIALIDSHLCDEELKLSFAEMNEIVRKSATVFADLGIKKGSNVAVLGENSARWLMIDHGIQMAGGASAVRGADAPVDELLYIYEHSDSAGIAAIQGPRLLNKLIKNAKENGLESLGLKNDSNGPVKTVILMHREKQSDEEIAKLAEEAGVEVKLFADLLKKADPIDENRRPKIGNTDLATIGTL